MVDIDELERLLAAATPGEWDTEFDPIDAGDHATAVCLPGKAGSLGTFLAYCQHNWGEAVYNERRISWKEATSNAALIVAARNSLPAMIAEIRELRAENARLREAIKPQWFYLGDDQSSDKCRFAPYEVIDEDFFCWGVREAEGAHIVHISTALPGPDIWAVVRVLTEAEKDARGDDEPWIIEEYPTEELARAALGEPQ